MTRGVPVACSDRGALEEVAADAALQFDPESEADIAAALERLLGDPVERERRRAAGYRQSAKFTWAAAAAGTIDAYVRAANPSASGAAG
jgi:alpha-1,3-rhamnosyl/mannosyltransferase